MELAKRLVDVACEAKADAIKFQTFKRDLCITKNAQRAKYQMTLGEKDTQYDMVRDLELSLDESREIKRYCDS